jgi:hypothetical protein
VSQGLAPIIHALFVAADQLDRVVDEMPEPICGEQRVMLTALARAAQLTAEELKKQESARVDGRRLEGVRG